MADQGSNRRNRHGVPADRGNQPQDDELYRPTDVGESREYFEDREAFYRRKQAAMQSQQQSGCAAPAQSYGSHDSVFTTQVKQQSRYPASVQSSRQYQGYESYGQQASIIEAGYHESSRGHQAANPIFPRQSNPSQQPRPSQITLSSNSFRNITRDTPERINSSPGFRRVYLMINESQRLLGGRPNPSHGALYIPYANQDRATVIEATGVPSLGFRIGFVRGYNLQLDMRRKYFINLGQIEEKHLYDCDTAECIEGNEGALRH